MHVPPPIRLTSIHFLPPGLRWCRLCDHNCVNLFLQEKCRNVSRERRPTGTRTDAVQSGTYVLDKALPAKVCGLQHQVAALCWTMRMLATHMLTLYCRPIQLVALNSGPPEIPRLFNKKMVYVYPIFRPLLHRDPEHTWNCVQLRNG